MAESVTMTNAGDWRHQTTSPTSGTTINYQTWTPGYWTYFYPSYTEDKATVAFRILKRLVDKGLIKPNLSLKKFLGLVEEIVKCL